MILALQSQSHSLRNVICAFTERNTYQKRPRLPVPDDGFSNFTALESLTLIDGDDLFFSILASRFAPPNLVHLQIRRTFDGILERDIFTLPAENEINIIMHPDTAAQYLPRLKKIDLAFETYSMRRIFPKIERKNTIVELGKQYEKIGVELSVAAVIRRNFIPPYLFGEKAEVIEIGYVHNKIGFRTGEDEER
jgi:hypothetical protein